MASAVEKERNNVDNETRARNGRKQARRAAPEVLHHITACEGEPQQMKVKQARKETLKTSKQATKGNQPLHKQAKARRITNHTSISHARA